MICGLRAVREPSIPLGVGLSLATIPSGCEINDMKARMRIRSAITMPVITKNLVHVE